MGSRSLDYTPLTGRVGLRGRLRALSGDNLLVMGMTIGVILAAGGLAGFLGQHVSGRIDDFGWFCLGFAVPCGVGVMASALLQAGKGGAIAAFARANDLQLTEATMARSYAGSCFADGSHLVRQSVRTRGEAFIEVGDRWPVTAAKGAISSAIDTGQAVPHQAMLFLRIRRAGVPSRRRSGELITSAIDDELRRLAGSYSVEISRRELTVFGSLPLKATKDGRMERAIALADTLAEAFGAVEGVRVVSSEAPVPEERDGRPMGAVKVVGVSMALFVIGPIVIALPMSLLDGALRGRTALATVAVVGLVAVVTLVVTAVVRRITTPRRRRKR